jgi:hypothetical protein
VEDTDDETEVEEEVRCAACRDEGAESDVEDEPCDYHRQMDYVPVSPTYVLGSQDYVPVSPSYVPASPDEEPAWVFEFIDADVTLFCRLAGGEVRTYF